MVVLQSYVSGRQRRPLLTTVFCIFFLPSLFCRSSAVTTSFLPHPSNYQDNKQQQPFLQIYFKRRIVRRQRLVERLFTMMTLMNTTRLGARSFLRQGRTQQQNHLCSHPHLHARGYTVPIVLEQGALGERSFDIFSRLLRERIICVHGPVTDQMASVVTAQLLFLEAEAPDKPLYIYINSPGGSVTAGLAMYDTMQYIRCDIHTIAMGQAASMGSLLLAGGSPGCRKALPHASIMVHQPSGGAEGMVSIRKVASNLHLIVFVFSMVCD